MTENQTNEESFLRKVADQIASGPVLVLAALMTDDNEQCEIDLASFGRALPAAVALGRFGPLFEGALDELRSSFSDRFKKVNEEKCEGRTLLQIISPLAAVTIVLPPDQAAPYVAGLMNVGEAIVKGSGGPLSKERKRKKQCLQQIRKLLLG
jgi:hypothetical protein